MKQALKKEEQIKIFLDKGNMREIFKIKHSSERNAQSCLTLCDPIDCSLSGSSLQGILQPRILQWVVISFSRGSSKLRDWTQASHIPGRRFNLWATREAQEKLEEVF